jgi:hypothetical protein
MKTSSWTPSGPSGYGNPDQLGLDQRFSVTVHGGKPDELEGIAAVYMALAYLQASRQFSVSTLEGVEVAHNRGGKLTGLDAFRSAMYLMEQSLNLERRRAINDTMDHIAQRAGIDLEAVLAEREARQNG